MNREVFLTARMWPVERHIRVCLGSIRGSVSTRAGILAMVRRRQEVVRAAIESLASAGDRVFTGLRTEGRVADIDNNIAYLKDSHHEWAPFLR